MNKADLTEAIALNAKVSKADAERCLDATMEAISKALKKGDRIALVGFGSFSVKKRAARVGRNPATGEQLNLPSKNVVKFKAGQDLSEAINKKK